MHPFKKQIFIENDKFQNKLVIDFSNLVVVAVTSIFRTDDEQINLTQNDVKNAVLFTLTNILKKYKSKYPEVIIAVDNTKTGSYKKEFAPYYKAHRSKARETSKINWDILFSEMEILKEDLKSIFGYKVIDIQKLEADDVIGYIANQANCKKDHEIMIISTDGDFKQLHSKYVKQYSIVKEKQITPDESPFAELVVKIIKGDSKDSVSPMKVQSYHSYNQNIGKSELNEVKRAPSIKADELKKYISAGNLTELRKIISEEYLDRFDENVKLLDLTILPDSYKIQIDNLLQVNNQKSNNKIYSYFLSNNLTKLLDSIQYF